MTKFPPVLDGKKGQLCRAEIIVNLEDRCVSLCWSCFGLILTGNLFEFLYYHCSSRLTIRIYSTINFETS